MEPSPMTATTYSNTLTQTGYGKNIQIPASPIGTEDNRLYLNIEIAGKIFPALVDPGAVASFIGTKAVQELGAEIFAEGGYMTMPNGQVERLRGSAKITLKLDGKEITTLIKIPRTLDYDLILGMDILSKLKMTIDLGARTWHTDTGIVRPFYPKNRDPGVILATAAISGVISDIQERQRKQLDKLIFDLTIPIEQQGGPAKLKPHVIDVQGSRPIKQRMRRISPKLLAKAHAEIDRLLAEDIIEPSESGWSSCPVIVPKSDGKIRFCIDYRNLNKVTKKFAYPLPHMDMLLDNLRNCKFLSKIDLSHAYHQIPLDINSKEFTAFAAPGKGLFQFKRLPYGITNAPASFQSAMDDLFGEKLRPNVFVYMDDIIIATDTFEKHLYYLELVLKKLKDANLAINREKSEFCCSEVKYLGYVINKSGLQTDPDKVAPILNYPPPRNLKQLRRFLGMIGWYARFIPDLAAVKLPLSELLKKNVAWKWEEDQKKAFEKLLILLTEAPILARPDHNLPFALQTDASSFALGAVLTQTLEGEEHPIAYASRTLSKAERNYTVTEKECLAVLWAVEKFRGYLLGEEFTVITDHSSLRWLHNLKDPAGRLARWATALQGYNMKIEHRKGALHKVPDALSRMYEDEVCCLAATGLIESDNWYAKRKRAVEEKPDKYPNWKVQNNLLYKHCPNSRTDNIISDLDDWKLVVTELDRERAIFECHNTPYSGHMGAYKTLCRLMQSYFWPKMRKDVEKYVKRCPDCQMYKVSQQGPTGLMGQRKIEGPWITVAADVMGPLPRSKGQCRYIVVFQDLFTKYVEIRPIREATAKSILKALEELVLFR